MSGPLSDLYRPSMALLTDLYELTMAYGYWKLGRAELPAAFEMSFRTLPFGGGFAVAAGLAQVIDYLEHLHFDEADLAYLRGLTGNDGTPLFEEGFLDYLSTLKFACDVDAAVEGDAVFGHEPIVRVVGPLLQAQILETPLLTLLNFSTLAATKAARVCLAAKGDPVIEFGLRRAQGPDGGVTASRAAYIGGCAGTSNLLAGRMFGIPVKGTHAHSWVMSYLDETQAFEDYARVMPHNSILLVDTYDTLEGVRRAAQVGKKMRARGQKLAGIRLDSGDLAYLSIEARRILDEAGLTETKILASNDLDEHVIESLKEQGARIDLWGVGTKLATAYDQPALGGVYKLAAIGGKSIVQSPESIVQSPESEVHRPESEVRSPKSGTMDYGQWTMDFRGTIKLSEQAVKVNTPGLLRVRRYFQDGRLLADMVYDERFSLPAAPTMVDPKDPSRRRRIPAAARHVELLKPIFRAGRRVYEPPSLADSRAHAQSQLDALHPAIKRLLNPHEYPVGLEASLHERKMRLMDQVRHHV